MPIFEIDYNTVSEIPVLLADGSGNGVSGVGKGQIDPYYKKKGGSFTQLSSTYFDWAEEDATNLPGQYTLTINSSGVSAV